jgi:hypothetical protein
MQDRVTWSLENAGSVIQFDPRTPQDYVKAAGASGLGVAPTTLTLTGSVSGGATWRRTKRGARTITFPVSTFGLNRDDVEDKLRALVQAFDDSYTTPLLVATYPDGSQFETEVHYSGGADHQWGSGDTDGQTYCNWVIQFTAPSPYFTARTLTPVTVGSTGGRGLIRPGGSLSQLRLTSSQALGKVTVNNPGDVEAWAVLRIVGPGSQFIGRRAIDGATLNLKTDFQPDNPVVIDAKAKTVIDAKGNNLYGGLIGAPKFFSLPRGQSTIEVALFDAGANASITLSFAERRELIF